MYFKLIFFASWLLVYPVIQVAVIGLLQINLNCCTSNEFSLAAWYSFCQKWKHLRFT